MLLFMDGMAHYDTAGLPFKYTTVQTAACTWGVVAEGRYGNAIKRVSTTNATVNLGYLGIAPLMTRSGLWTPTTSGVCGFAYKLNDLEKISVSPPFQSNINDLFAVVEGANAHVKVSITPQGTFLLRGREDTIIGQEIILAQSAEGIQSNNWVYLEFKWVIHETAGSFLLRVNGITLIDFTGNTNQQWTLPTPMFTGVWTAVALLGMAAQHQPSGVFLTQWMSDLYLADLTAPAADDVHDFLGDGIVETIMPNGVGASTGWTPSGTANWDMTNDRPAHDGDGTYVRATPAGTKDSYHFEDIPPGSIVKGAHLNILARKEEEGSAAIQPVIRPTTTDFLGPTQGIANVVYDRYLTQPVDVNPETGVAWTAAEINASQFGILKVS